MLDLVATLTERLPLALDDAELRAAARGLDARIRLACGDAAIDIVFASGAPTRWCEPADGAIDVALTATSTVWEAALAPVPPPRHQSFTALQLANADATVAGDPLRIAQARPALERLLEVLRPAPCSAAGGPEPAPAARDMGQVIGRYASLATRDGPCEVFYEAAGSGSPVVFLHTAGADSRQYGALLSDVALARDWRLLAFDCPFHGRSLPPLGWDGGAYHLDGARYASWVTAFLESVAAAPAILVGCSMGAAIALTVAAERPDLLRGVVALEAPLLSPGRRNPYLAHAAVSGGTHNGAYVRGLMSPTSPEPWRRRAAWIYAQGGPGVYAGDLAFYSEEFDGTRVAPRIDAGRLPIYLLTGTYDYSATAADGAALAALMPGSVFREMPGLGHFPMSENPDLFRPHFTRALEAIRAAGRRP